MNAEDIKRKTATHRRIALVVVIVLVALASGAAVLRYWKASVTVPGENSFTIYLLGGSTALGEPYYPVTDLGMMTAWLVGNTVQGLPVQVRNLGGGGKPADLVVDDARMVADLQREKGNAVALLYLGNNEFLRFDDEHDLSKDNRRLFDVPTLGADAYENVLSDYRSFIEEIITILRSASVTVIAVAPAVNLKDWEPNRSVLADPANRKDVETLLGRGDRMFRTGRLKEALEAYQAILRLEPRFAFAAKRAGDCCERLKRYDQARSYYQSAVDNDGNPYRETTRQRELLKDVCRRLKVPVIDASKLFEDASPDGLAGYDLFWDNCHPTLRGYSLIAGAIADQLRVLYEAKPEQNAKDLQEMERAFGIDATVLAQIYRGRGEYCYRNATLIWDPKLRLDRAEFYLNESVRLAPADADLLCSLAIVAALRGDRDASLAKWREAYRWDRGITLHRAAPLPVEQIMRRLGVRDLAASIQ